MSKPYVMEPVERYGFRWGLVVVIRYFSDRRGRALGITTDHEEIVVYVSPKGRNIRVIKGNREMKVEKP